MKPRLILAMICGGAAGVGTFMVTGAGLVATPSPGSIFAYIAETPRGGYFGVLLGVLVAAAVTFVVAGMLLGFGRLEPAEETGGTELPEDVAAEEDPVTARVVAERTPTVTTRSEV